MVKTVTLDQFVRLAIANSNLRATARKLRDRRRNLNPDLIDVLRLADTTQTAGAARGCFAIAKAEGELLSGLTTLIEGRQEPETTAAIRAWAVLFLQAEMGNLFKLSDAELGAFFRALTTVHAAGQLDSLDRMANQIANEIATTVAER